MGRSATKSSFAAAIRRPDRTNAPLWAASAEFAGGSAAGEGYFVRIPATVAARAGADAMIGLPGVSVCRPLTLRLVAG